MMNARATICVVTAALATLFGCSRRSALVVRDSGADSSTEQSTGGASTGGASAGMGGWLGTGGAVGIGGVAVGGLPASGGAPGSGGVVGSGGAVHSGGWLGSGGRISTGGNLASGGAVAGGSGGGGAGGNTDCYGLTPLGTGIAGGACEGAARCNNVPTATLGYETCSWLAAKGRASVFEAVRACFGRNPDFCSQQPASVEACTAPIFARACPGPGVAVNGTHVDCRDLAADCAAVSEDECHLLLDVLSEKYYQAAFECYFGQSPRPSDCRAALRKCTGVPVVGTGGAGGAVGSGGAGGSTASQDGGLQAACPYLAGTWSVDASCKGPGALSSGAFVAVVTQTGCEVTFTQTDDQTPTQWISKGTIDSTGRGSLRGAFGFTDSSMCDVETTSSTWTGRCGSATQTCQLKAEKVMP